MTKPVHNLPLVPEEFRNSFEQLVQEIDNLVDVRVLKALGGGFSDSIPVLVVANYEHTGTHQVFKIGESNIIVREAENWKNFIENGPYEHLHIVHMKGNPIQGSPHSLIIYNFAGRPDADPTTYDNHYENLRNPENTLKGVFSDILQTTSHKIRRDDKLPEIKNILSIGKRNKEMITKEIKRLTNRHDVLEIPKIRVDGEKLYNPLYFYPFSDSLQPEPAAVNMPTGIVHGDFHGKNVLFYQTRSYQIVEVQSKKLVSEVPCIIDYAHTGIKSLYTDIAKMESALKFQILKVDKIDPGELLQFEDKNILCNTTPSNNPSVTDSDLKILFPCIEVLRSIASEIIKDGYLPLGYWLMLYRNTLLHIKYADLSDSQKRYAFISAALILTRHLAA